jgi:hypothetical protein
MVIRNMPTVRDLKRGYPALVARVVALEARVGMAGSPSPQGPRQPQEGRREAVQDTSGARKATSDGKPQGGKKSK